MMMAITVTMWVRAMLTVFVMAMLTMSMLTMSILVMLTLVTMGYGDAWRYVPWNVAINEVLVLVHDADVVLLIALW